MSTRFSSRLRRSTAIAFALLTASSALILAGGASPAKAATPPWTTSWGVGINGTNSLAAKDFTCREIAPVTLGGATLRIHLTNALNTEPVTFGAVTAAHHAGGGATDAAVPVTFGGRRSVSIPAGEERASDPVPLSVVDGSEIAVSLYVPGQITSYPKHDIGPATNYCTSFAGAAGDRTQQRTASAFTPVGTATAWLAAIDVRGTALDRTIVTFGDSLTDGPGRYPDRLFQRLRGTDVGTRFAVVNSGIAGNTVITPLTKGSPPGVSRFARDVTDHDGIRHVVIFEGTNDIGAGANAETVIAGLKRLIAAAHASNLVVTLATLTPRHNGCGHSNDRIDDAIESVNDWIRTNRIVEYKVDFNAAVRSRESPNCLDPRFDKDHLHFNDVGNQQIADAVDLKNFTTRAGAISAPGGMCVDLPGGASADGTRAELYDCLGDAQQSWAVIPGGTVRAYGKCLSVEDDSTRLRAAVVLSSCRLSSGQFWKQRPDGSLLNAASGLCLDAPRGATARRTRLQVWTCNGLPAQHFVLPGAGPLSP